MEITNLLLRMQSFEDEFRNYPADTVFPVEKALEFYSFMVPFVTAINELKDTFDNEFKARGIDISKK